MRRAIPLATLSLTTLAWAPALASPMPTPQTSAEILAAAPSSAWEAIPPEELLVMTVAGQAVLIELAPTFAPKNVANVRTLVSEGFFDGLAIVRSQDNYVVQWADPNDETEQARPLGSAKAKVKPEFDRALRGLELTPLPSADAYADQVGFAGSLPVGSDGDRAWLTHCYSMVGVARGNPTSSGNGSSLYVVTGHAPRHLDRNITVVGRVIDGMPVLSAAPRGSGPMGFYAEGDSLLPIASVRLASDLPEDARPAWERLRTDTPTFEAYLESKRTRTEAWFAQPVGRIGLCNVPLPRREQVRAGR